MAVMMDIFFEGDEIKGRIMGDKDGIPESQKRDCYEQLDNEARKKGMRVVGKHFYPLPSAEGNEKITYEFSGEIVKDDKD